MGLFDFFRPRREPAKPAYATALGGRYEGRPLLILLENYVLAAIGHLPPDKDKLNASITQRIFGGGDNWRATLRDVLHLEASPDEEMRDLWTTAQSQTPTPNPVDFARRMVDENFAHLIERLDS